MDVHLCAKDISCLKYAHYNSRFPSTAFGLKKDHVEEEEIVTFSNTTFPSWRTALTRCLIFSAAMPLISKDGLYPSS